MRVGAHYHILDFNVYGMFDRGTYCMHHSNSLCREQKTYAHTDTDDALVGLCQQFSRSGPNIVYDSITLNPATGSTPFRIANSSKLTISSAENKSETCSRSEV